MMITVKGFVKKMLPRRGKKKKKKRMKQGREGREVIKGYNSGKILALA